ncbi:hypothetical protein IC006_1498 [Sulfuracidifex tepidarius]|uniref:Uncharacterized protein n=1 Tax=Sulfuracidifex tepidarius TaxID=1294262 RepID=A0A510DVF1_9CREN|nr:hypothetical protein [Sulfuracidifex tepidarius]BBG24191.1 hypothetical protein IC006_1498 [Sulfuracidifex tepidarius]
MKAILIISLIFFLLLSSMMAFSGSLPQAMTYSESRQTSISSYVLNFTFEGQSVFPVTFNLSSSLDAIVVTFNCSLINAKVSPSTVSIQNRSVLIPYYILPSNSTPLKIKMMSKEVNGTLTVKVIEPDVNITSFLENNTGHSSSLPDQSEKQTDLNSHYLVLLFIIPLIVYILLVYVNKRK